MFCLFFDLTDVTTDIYIIAVPFGSWMCYLNICVNVQHTNSRKYIAI